MKGGHTQRRRFSLQALCVVHSPTSEEEPTGMGNLHQAQSSGDGSNNDDGGGTPPISGSHRLSRRRRPPSVESSASNSRPSSRNLAPPSAPVKSHYKVVLMGSARTGKTSLVSQFLYTVYSPRYRPTVEDMHTVELDCQGLDLRLDILDTGGSYVFPAMRSLAIKSADGFVLVCAADDPSSLEEVEHCRSQIIEVKGATCPTVVVLNKIDLLRSGSVSSETSQKSTQMEDEKSNATNSQRKNSIGYEGRCISVQEDSDFSPASSFICQEMVESLVTCDWGHGFVSASAKNNYNVVQVFQELFDQAKSRIALSPAVRKRRQSLPARPLIPNGIGTNLNSSNHIGHHFSLHGSNAAAAAAAAAAVANASSPEASNGHSISSIKRNSCTVS